MIVVIFDYGDQKGANENHQLSEGSLNLSCRKEGSRKSSFGFHFWLSFLSSDQQLNKFPTHCIDQQLYDADNE